MRRSVLVPVLFAAAPIAAVLSVPTSAPAAPSIGNLGVEFSASIPSDVQRDEGEPEVSVDPAGNIYTCGPSGFSNIADYAQVSRDGGDQFHLLGIPPRGQISAGEGGGDCGLASAPVKNELDQYTWAYTGLGPLTNFSTGTARDTGKTLHGKTTSESIPGVDRQWMVFTDKNTVFLNYNQLAQGFTVQKSTDGGYSYEPAGTVASEEGGRIGPMRAILTGDPATAKVYFPFNSGNEIKLAMSLDGGDTWGTCLVGDAEVDPTAGFVVADHDSAGNIFVTYAQKGAGHDTYVMVVPAKNVGGCQDDGTVGDGRKILMNRGDIKTTVMPWVVASGLPGRFAVAFYGTDQEGDPNLPTFKGAWRVYVSMTLDAFAPSVPVGQVTATSHPMHYDSICLDGLNCTIDSADRTLVDYFAMDMNPADGRLNIVYNNAAKKPDEATGHVGLPVVMTQMSGPSLTGGTLTPKRPRTRQTSSDPSGDALAPYGTLCATPPGTACPAPATANRPAMDFVDRGPKDPAVEIEPEIDLETGEPVDDGGFTVTMRVADLSTAQLQAAAAAGGGASLIYLFRWNNGYQPVGATARWSPITGWSYAFDDYETTSTESGQADPTAEKIIIYPGDTEIPGDVNTDSGVIRLSIPRSVIKGLGAPFDEHRRPSEVEARPGTLLTSAVAYSLVNILPITEVQSYFYPVDNAPAMDFVLPGRAPLRPGIGTDKDNDTDTGTGGGGDGDDDEGTGGGRIPTTGGLGAPLVALALSSLGLLLVRRRRAAAA